MRREVSEQWFARGRAGATALLRRVIPPVRRSVRGGQGPSVSRIARRTPAPFRILVATVISARTRDEVTGPASERLFALAATPRAMAALPLGEIERAIYPAGFYRAKARALSRLSSMLVAEYGGKVPESIEELVRLPGVGRKTANLVTSLAFGRPGICVDTHVHRICNRLGAVRTTTPVETEAALRAVLPRRYWIEINELLVMFGQKTCTPLSPWCSRCALAEVCDRCGVIRHR